MAGFLCTNIYQVSIFHILDILFMKKYPEMGRDYYRIVSSVVIVPVGAINAVSLNLY